MPALSKGAHKEAAQESAPEAAAALGEYEEDAEYRLRAEVEEAARRHAAEIARLRGEMAVEAQRHAAELDRAAALRGTAEAALAAARTELRRLRQELTLCQRALAAQRVERQREREAAAVQLAAARGERRDKRDSVEEEDRQLERAQQQEEEGQQLQRGLAERRTFNAAAECAVPAAVGGEPQQGPESEREGLEPEREGPQEGPAPQRQLQPSPLAAAPGELPQPADAAAAADSAAAGAEAGAAEAPQGARAADAAAVEIWGRVRKWDDKCNFGFVTGEHDENVIVKKRHNNGQRIPPGCAVRLRVRPGQEGKQCTHEALMVLEVHPPAGLPAGLPAQSLPYAAPAADGPVRVLQLRVLRTPHSQTPLRALETRTPPAGPVTECEAAAEALRALLAAADESGAAQGYQPPASQKQLSAAAEPFTPGSATPPVDGHAQGQRPPAGAPQPQQPPDQAAAEVQELLDLLGRGGSGAAGGAAT